MEKPRELSKKDIRSLEEQEKALKAQKQQQTARRKRLTGIGLAGGTAILAATVCLGAIMVSQQNPEPTPPTQTGDLYGEEAWKIVRKEIKRLGIEGSEREAALWSYMQKFYPEITPTDPEERRAAVKEIVVQTIAAMGASENPYFKNANRIIADQLSKKNLIFDVGSIGMPYAIMNAENNDGNVAWTLIYNTDRILQDRSSSYLAMILTHEASHIEQAVEFRKMHADMPTDEFIDFYHLTSNDQEYSVVEESLAYAEGANSFIHSAGLMTSVFTEDFTPMLDAANLIRCDRDATSNCWTSYIASDPRRLGSE